ncbi:MAG: hypothetical protein ACEPO8_00935 [Rhodothermaceae bacterium]
MLKGILIFYLIFIPLVKMVHHSFYSENKKKNYSEFLINNFNQSEILLETKFTQTDI